MVNVPSAELKVPASLKLEAPTSMPELPELILEASASMLVFRRIQVCKTGASSFGEAGASGFVCIECWLPEELIMDDSAVHEAVGDNRMCGRWRLARHPWCSSR